MRKSYTSVPLDTPDPLTGQSKGWMPYLRVRVSKGHVSTPGWILAVVDSGATHCLFRDDVARVIGIRDITANAKTATIGGVRRGMEETYYFHKVKLFIEGNWMIEVLAGFSASMSVPAILGRNGFFDQFSVTFDHSASPPAMEISKFDKVQ